MSNNIYFENGKSVCVCVLMHQMERERYSLLQKDFV